MITYQPGLAGLKSPDKQNGQDDQHRSVKPSRPRSGTASVIHAQHLHWRSLRFKYKYKYKYKTVGWWSQKLLWAAAVVGRVTAVPSCK
jgi:hypothetical protein